MSNGSDDRSKSTEPEASDQGLLEKIVTVLSMSGRTMTLGDIKGAMRELFAMTFTTEESQALRSLLDRQPGGVVAEGLGYRLATRR